MEILKLKKTAQEAASLAAERSSKCKIAMQAIKTITVQVIQLFHICSSIFANVTYLHQKGKEELHCETSLLSV